MGFADKCSLHLPYPYAKSDLEHAENYKELSRWANRMLMDGDCIPGGGGGKIPYYVAAVDASDEAKALSDYVCDGTADNVEIQAAVDAAEASTLGKGTVILSEGTFTLAAAVSMTAHISFQGQGAASTKVVGPTARGGIDCLDYTSLDTTFGGVSISGIHFTQFWSAIYGWGMQGLVVSDCVFEDALYGLYVDDLWSSAITNCQFYDDHFGVFVNNTTYRSSVANNTFWASQRVDITVTEPGGMTTITGNNSQGSRVFVESYGNHYGLVISDNVFSNTAGRTEVTILLNGDNPNDALTWPVDSTIIANNVLHSPAAVPGVIHVTPTASNDYQYPLLHGNKVYGRVYLDGVTEVFGNSFVGGLYVANGAAGSKVSNNSLGDTTLWGSAPPYTLNEETAGNANVGAGNYLDGTWTP